MYDFTHWFVGCHEEVTALVCTLEFQDHRPLWRLGVGYVEDGSSTTNLKFARLNLNYTVTSKRKVWSSWWMKNNYMVGMIRGCRTILVLRRRGYYSFILSVIFAIVLVWQKSDKYCWCRYVWNTLFVKDLDASANRAMVVLNRFKVTLNQLPWRKKKILPRWVITRKMKKRGTAKCHLEKSCTLTRRLCRSAAS